MKTLVLAFWAAVLAFPRPALATEPDQEPVRTLFIGLDAVPYRTVADLADPARGDAALFQGMKGPVPLISTFPSTTSLAFAGILEPLGLDKSPGYEARFYDWSRGERGKIHGGGLFTYNKIVFPWRHLAWDWKLRGLFAKLTSGAHPVGVVRRSIRRSLEAFANSDKEAFFIYYTTTDLVSHLKSPPGLEPSLTELDRRLEELRREHPERPFRTVLFSDHGMDGGAPLDNVRKDTRKALQAAGFRLRSKKLAHDGDVVLVPFGLVSSLVAFTSEASREGAARTIARVEGVDVCAVPVGEDAWRVHRQGESALVRRRGDLWAYEPDEGDPLRLAGLAKSGPGEDGFHPDDWWLEETRDGEYPDPLYRIARGFDLVENPASVICGMEPGYMFGPFRTEFASLFSVGRLKWTHGALYSEATLGFLMSDDPDWEPSGPVRFDQALLPFIGGREIELPGHVKHNPH